MSKTISTEWNRLRTETKVSKDEILKFLVYAGKVKSEPLADEIAEYIIGLIKDDDPDVRMEAIYSGGLHWRLSAAIKPIVELLEHENDIQVLLCAITSLGALGMSDDKSSCLCIRALAGMALRENMTGYVRAAAYLEILRIQKTITFQEYVRLDKELSEEFVLSAADLDRIRHLAFSSCT